MNEKTGFAIFVSIFVIGIVFGIVVTYGYYNSTINELSGTIGEIKEINNRLQLSNIYLSSINSGITKKIGELEERIIRDDKEYQGRLREISIGLGGISEGLDERTREIQSVIDGIEKIKLGFKEIEISK